MIAFFPEIYPDELLYSQIARYHSRSGYACYVYTVSDIYQNGKLVHPNVDFVNKYTPDAMNWITKNDTWENIVFEHTMYPAYIRFLPKQRRIDAMNGIITCEGNWKNLMCIPLLNEPRYIRYCPECVKEDRKKYGETYWHRSHQIPRIKVCPQHKCFLENSEIPVSSKSSPGLYDAENNIPKKLKTRICENEREINFTQYIIDIMREPIDLGASVPIGTFLHSNLKSEYICKSGLVRNISKLYEDYLEFYNDMPTMELSYIQKIFNNYRFDPYFILQIAFLLGISIYEITHLPVETYIQENKILYMSLAKKHGIDYNVVADIASAVLKDGHIFHKTGPKQLIYEELDKQYLPQVKRVVRQILNNKGRPEKVSFAKVQKALGLPQKQIYKLPKCKTYIQKNIESQPEFWAREIEWAVNKLIQENKPLNTSRIMKLTNMRLRDIEISVSYIQNKEIQELVRELLSYRDI
ncbi:MAG: TniQ family protein [Candidatus Fimenecus sp.]